jgi:asparagine synthase (glutamine-hydrolysing)
MPGIALAARRLAVIDLEGGHQPVGNESGDVQVVQNGEIYNYRELRDRLIRRGHRFASACDTEVIVHLYEEEGADFARHLEGMFAIALWDSAQKCLILARDRFGIKPLLYTTVDGELAFSSELKSLLEVPNVSRIVSEDSLQTYLTFNYIPGHRTILRDVHRLRPGHLLILQDGRVELREYGAPSGSHHPADHVGVDERSLAEELLARLRSSVRAHMVADVPVGVLLSGGIDSSVLTALAAEVSPGISTFSIGFSDSTVNELEKARIVAHEFGTDHHELIVEPELTELLPRLVAAFDEPLGDSSLLPTYLVAELARKHVTVALAGEGGDELFGGYWSYAADSICRVMGRPISLAQPLVGRMRDARFRSAGRLKRLSRGAALPPFERHCAWQAVFERETVAELMVAAPTPGGDPLEEHRRRYQAAAPFNWLTRLQDVDVGTYLASDLLMKSDLASMAHSLELRVPFLDLRVSEFAYALAAHHKVRYLSKKRLLRRAARSLLPPGIVDAPKQGFSIPAASWLRAELKPLIVDTLVPDTLRRQGFLKPAVVERLARSHFNGQENVSAGLWGLLMFTLWVDEYGASPG